VLKFKRKFRRQRFNFYLKLNTLQVSTLSIDKKKTVGLRSGESGGCTLKKVCGNMLIRNFPFFGVGKSLLEFVSSVSNRPHILKITIYAVGQCSCIYVLFNDASNSSDFTVPTFDMTNILPNKLVQLSLLFCSPWRNSLILVASNYSQHLKATVWINTH